MAKQPKYPGLNKARKEIREMLEATTFKSMKTINAIAIKSASNSNAKFDDLIKLVADEGVLYQAIGNISGKSGALTKGPKLDERTVDATSKDLVKKLSQDIKSGKFKFKPIRRIYMDRSGKNPATKSQQEMLIELHKLGPVSMQQVKEVKARPLGISSFPDKVVQESIRIVLNAIYEPEFAKQNVNCGFRPKYGCADAILAIQRYAKQMSYCIEGDIKGAFDNVNHEILIKILGKKIQDKKLLSLIYNGLKCGVMFLDFEQSSDLGTVQGSMVSPLLYNIYFNEFDNYINTEFKKLVEDINTSEGRSPRPFNKLYNSYSKKKTMLKLNNDLKTVKEYSKDPNCDMNKLMVMQSRLKDKLKKYKEIDKLQKKVPAFAASRQTIRIFYQRYADDFVFFTNADKERVLEWKTLFTEWIRDNLSLELSPEKTNVADLRKGELVKFLGFQMSRANKNRRLVKVGRFKTIRTDIARRSKVVKVKIDEPKIQYQSRATNPTLIVTWDRDRVLSRMVNYGFIRKLGNTYRGRSKLPWTVLSENEIIDRYNYIIRGYIDYYTPVSDYPTGIQYLWYLLKYSCAHTLAQKRRTTLRSIFRKFGKDISVNYIEKTIIRKSKGLEETKKISKTTALINWDKVLQIIRQTLINVRRKEKDRKTDSISIINRAVDDICNVKINWRTAYKLNQHCVICGCTDKVEYHHVKHIRKGKVTGFLQLMNQLNRKQTPVCKECHKKIHKGLYDSMALDQLYDEQLIIL